MGTEKVETRHQKRLAKIEYENVTLRIPKKLMEFIRNTPGGYGSSAINYLEYSIVDMIRADLEALSGEEIIAWSGLGSVFHAILKEKRFVSL
jgi:glucokinase